jgi:hypothetical protein
MAVEVAVMAMLTKRAKALRLLLRLAQLVKVAAARGREVSQQQSLLA